MNKFIIIALLGAASAIYLRKADLPHDEAADKVDPLSRYVNDDDILQIHDGVKLAQINKADLPHSEEADKIDPYSRYVNDDDIVQLKDDV